MMKSVIINKGTNEFIELGFFCVGIYMHLYQFTYLQKLGKINKNTYVYIK